MPELTVKLVSASWCEPCKVLKPLVKGICEENDIKLEVYDVDTTEGSQFASQYGVRGVPATFIFEGSNVKDTLVGLKSKQDILKSLGLK